MYEGKIFKPFIMDESYPRVCMMCQVMNHWKASNAIHTVDVLIDVTNSKIFTA